jgi:hypothetical protein
MAIALGAFINFQLTLLLDAALIDWTVAATVSGATFVGLLAVAITYVTRTTTRRLRR